MASVIRTSFTISPWRDRLRLAWLILRGQRVTVLVYADEITVTTTPPPAPSDGGGDTEDA
jgi:hypothetical protein